MTDMTSATAAGMSVQLLEAATGQQIRDGEAYG